MSEAMEALRRIRARMDATVLVMVGSGQALGYTTMDRLQIQADVGIVEQALNGVKNDDE